MDEFVVIASFDSLQKAYMARNLLRGADILGVLDNMLAASPVTNTRYRCKDCGHTWTW